MKGHTQVKNHTNAKVAQKHLHGYLHSETMKEFILEKLLINATYAARLLEMEVIIESI